jgi:hypothetical protein
MSAANNEAASVTIPSAQRNASVERRRVGPDEEIPNLASRSVAVEFVRMTPLAETGFG